MQSKGLRLECIRSRNCPLESRATCGVSVRLPRLWRKVSAHTLCKRVPSWTNMDSIQVLAILETTLAGCKSSMSVFGGIVRIFRAFVGDLIVPIRLFRRHVEDFLAAIDYVRGLEEVNPRKIALFGSSFSGGHVLGMCDRAYDGCVKAFLHYCWSYFRGGDVIRCARLRFMASSWNIPNDALVTAARRRIDVKAVISVVPFLALTSTTESLGIRCVAIGPGDCKQGVKTSLKPLFGCRYMAAASLYCARDQLRSWLGLHPFYMPLVATTHGEVSAVVQARSWHGYYHAIHSLITMVAGLGCSPLHPWCRPILGGCSARSSRKLAEQGLHSFAWMQCSFLHTLNKGVAVYRLLLLSYHKVPARLGSELLLYRPVDYAPAVYCPGLENLLTVLWKGERDDEH